MVFILIAYVAHVLENTLIALVMKETGPYVYVPLSYVISTILVFTYEKAMHRRLAMQAMDRTLIASHKWPLLAYIGGAFFGNGLWFYSVYLVGIGPVSFVLIFIRLFVTVYAYAFLNDRYGIDKICAFIVAFVALVFYSYSGTDAQWLGLSLAFLSCLGFTAESVGKKMLANSGLKLERVVLWRYAILALLFCGLFGLLWASGFFAAGTLSFPSPSNMGLMIIACFLGSLGAGIAYFYGLKTVPLSVAEALNTTKPVILSLVGITFLNETMTASQMLWGAVIITASLYFIRPEKKRGKVNEIVP